MAECAGLGGGHRQMVVPAQSGRAISVSRGDLVRVRGGFVGIGSHLVVDCRAASWWIPAREEKSEQGLERRLAVVAPAILQRRTCHP